MTDAPRPASELQTKAAQIDALEAAAAPDTSAPTGATAPGPGSQPGPAGPAPVPGPDYVGDAREIIGMWTDTVTPLYPRLAEIYPPSTVDKLSERLGRVMQKYELSLAELLKVWAPEIHLAIVLLPVATNTYRIIREDNALAAARKHRSPAAHAPAPAPPNDRSAPAPAPAPAAPAAEPVLVKEPQPSGVTIPTAVDLTKPRVDPSRLHTLIKPDGGS